MVSVDEDDGEVGEEDEYVGEDVADDEEGPGVDHVGLTGSQEVHRAGVEISLVRISSNAMLQFAFRDLKVTPKKVS